MILKVLSALILSLAFVFIVLFTITPNSIFTVAMFTVLPSVGITCLIMRKIDICISQQ